jgi:hypothetical protein
VSYGLSEYFTVEDPREKNIHRATLINKLQTTSKDVAIKHNKFKRNQHMKNETKEPKDQRHGRRQRQVKEDTIIGEEKNLNGRRFRETSESTTGRHNNKGEKEMSAKRRGECRRMEEKIGAERSRREQTGTDGSRRE